MRALSSLRNAPLHAAVRLQTLRSTDSEAGMTTAEYAVGTVAACGAGGLLATILKSDLVRGLLERVITSALESIF